MIFTVTFSKTAQKELAYITVLAFNQKPIYRAISSAADCLENMLKYLNVQPPKFPAQALPNSNFLFFDQPLGIVYTCQPEDCLIQVLHVLYLGPAL